MDNEMRQGQWNWRSADWKRLKGLVERGLVEEGMERLNAEEAACAMQRVILEACEESVERVEGRVRQVRWWCEELADLRLEVRRKKRKWVRYRDETDRRVFVTAVTRYKRLVVEKKRDAWERDLERMNDGDLFGEAYKVLKRGRSRK